MESRERTVRGKGVGCSVQIGRSIRANPSPNGRGWPAPAGRVRGTASIKAILFICTPHPPLRGTLSRWERDSQIHTSDSENRLKLTFHRAYGRSNGRNLERPVPTAKPRKPGSLTDTESLPLSAQAAHLPLLDLQSPPRGWTLDRDIPN